MRVRRSARWPLFYGLLLALSQSLFIAWDAARYRGVAFLPAWDAPAMLAFVAVIVIPALPIALFSALIIEVTIWRGR